MEATNVERRGNYLIYIVFAAALALRFYRLGDQSFWADEAITIGMYRSPPAGISYFRKFLWDVHGPLYSMLMHFWSMASSSEFWLRTPGAFMGSLSVPMLYLWLRRIAKERTALIGALFLALSPFSLYYSQELRFYSMLSLFAVIALIAYNRFDRRPTWKNAILLGAVLGLTCLSHFSALLLCFGLFVHSLVSGRPFGDRLRKTLLAAAVLLVIISPWIYREIVFLSTVNIENISNMPAGERLRGDLTLSPWAYPYIFYAFSVGYSLGPSLRELHFVGSGLELLGEYAAELVAVVLVFGGALISSLFRIDWRRFGAVLLSITAVAIAGLTLVALFNIKVFNVRYLMSIFPLFIACLAIGVPERRIPALAVTAAVCAVMLVSDYNYHHDDRYARDDIRSAASLIEEMEEPGDAIVLQGVVETFDFYYDGVNRDSIVYPGPGGDVIPERLDAMTETAPRVWDVRARGFRNRIDDHAYQQLSRRMDRAGRWDFPGVTLYLFEREVE